MFGVGIKVIIYIYEIFNCNYFRATMWSNILTVIIE